MKNLKYILILFIALGYISAKAQGFITEDKKNIELKPGTNGMFKSNPLPMLSGPGWYTSEFRLIYEKPVTLNQSFMIGASYLGKGIFAFAMLDTTSKQIAINGYKFQLAYKFYFGNNSLNGFYIAPYFTYADIYIKEKHTRLYNSNYYKVSLFNFNGIVGYQFVDYRGFVIDTFVGLGYKDNSWYDNSDNTSGHYAIFPESKISYIRFTFAFNIGYAF